MSAENPTDDIIVFRACLKRRCGDLSGEGACIYGGRWNRKGQAVVYTSDTRALALLEMRVHYSSMPREAAGMLVLRLRSGTSILTLSSSELPAGWNHHGDQGIDICQSLGSKWFDSNHWDVLQVPSAVLQAQSNYIVRADSGILTPCEIEPLEFDPRLWPNPENPERRKAPEKISQMLRVLIKQTPITPII